jgi:hypothetical protein
MGVKHFCIGWDVRILHEWWRVNGEGIRGMIGSSAAPTAAASSPRQTAATY